MKIRIRPALLSDAQRINAIYNYYVLHSTCTWHWTEETDTDRIAWLKARNPAHPVLVIELEGKVVGWGSLSAYNIRQGWKFTVEDSVFIENLHHGKGLGKQMLQALIKSAQSLGHKSILARISAEQLASQRLHASQGFEKVGLLCGVGFKFGQKLDCLYMLKSLHESCP